MGALLLVPSSLRASRAARRLCDAEGGVLFGARVVTPDAILGGLLAAAGERRAILPPLAERLLALEAGEAAGGALAGLEPAGGLAAALAGAVAELRRGEVAAGVAAEVASGLPGAAAARLGALSAALRHYEARLDELGALDRAGAFRAAAAAARRGAASEETTRLDLLAVDGFHAPSPGEWDLLAALSGRARRTLFRVPALPERPDLFAGAEPMLRNVEGLHAAAGQRDVALSLPGADDRAPRLARVLRALVGGPGGGPEGEGGRVVAAAGAGERGEAERAAAILRGLLDGGVEPEEVLAFAPGPSRLAPLLAEACRAQGVPLAAGRAAPLAEAPPVRALRRALAAAADPGREALLAAAGTTWLADGAGEVRLGQLLDRAGATGPRAGPEALLRRRAAALSSGHRERAELLGAADALARARLALRGLASPARAQAFAAALHDLLRGPRRRAAREVPGRAVLDLGALEGLEQAAEAVARARAALGRGAEPLAPAGWLALLDLALGAAPGPAEPEPAAGAVELWPLAEAPGLARRAALVMGCARGRFPTAPPPEPLLREPERTALNRHLRRGSLATAGVRRADALLAAASALAAGREVVACTWPGPGPEGPGEAPSPLAVEAALLAGGAVEEAPAEPPLARARTAGEALRAAARALRAGEPEVLSRLAAASPELARRAADAAARGAAEAERLAAFEARRPGPFAGGIPAPALAPSLPAEWTPSQLESFARCPFRLFAELALSLREPDQAGLDIDPRDEGSLAHAVLEAFFRARVERGEGPLRGAPEEAEGLRAAARATFRRFEAEGRVGDPAAWAPRREAVLGRLLRAVAAEAREGGGLSPALVEHRFGGGGAAPALALEAGGPPVRLKGRIDRVDAGPDRLLVVDYKNAREGSQRDRLRPEALGVTSFQLPAYLLAAAQALPGRSRLEATFQNLKSASRAPPVALGAGDDLLALDPGRRAAIRARGGRPFADAVVEAVGHIRAGQLPVASRDCRGCGLGAVCRFEAVAGGEP